MAGKQRSLPSWMTKKEERKEGTPAKGRRKRKTASAVFYCMNEKELVEAAISLLCDAPREGAVLPRDRQGAPNHDLHPNLTEAEESVADATEKTKQKCSASEKTEGRVMEEEGQPSDGEDTPYVSETDEDIAELETLPYASSPPQREPAGQRSGPARDRQDPADVGRDGEGNAPAAAEDEAEDEDEDGDGLRLVREIFFR